jgi:hypothetical protein
VKLDEYASWSWAHNVNIKVTEHVEDSVHNTLEDGHIALVLLGECESFVLSATEVVQLRDLLARATAALDEWTLEATKHAGECDTTVVGDGRPWGHIGG